MIEQDAIKKRFLRNQGQPSSVDPTELVCDDVIRSATHGSVKQVRVIHAPVVDDCQAKQRATTERTLLYDTIKRFGHVPMFQYLALENSVDKCGHHYTICLDLKHQWFKVLDLVRLGDDTSLTSHAEFFVSNLKETWNRHYGISKVQISHFPVEYVLTDKQGNGYDCRYYMFEYLAKWEGRKVPAILKASVVELRKILTWN
ncbi:hypothetical protein D1007_18794 [Hordeum vulgare]|nr:hypothetical protein D1007_18794 [Hordeum vulgare]KAI4987270.1 hypothetical protein ZWY2020_020070 [Hordeum vulgare]